MGAFGDESLMFGGLFVEVWRRCCGRVWCAGDRFSGSFEDNWFGGAFDVVVFVAGWDWGGVNPALCFGGVEFEAEFLHICGYGVDGVLDVGVSQYLRPEASNLMCIVDLHNIELLYDLAIYALFLLFEHRNNLFSKINCDQIIKNGQRFDFFISL